MMMMGPFTDPLREAGAAGVSKEGVLLLSISIRSSLGISQLRNRHWDDSSTWEQFQKKKKKKKKKTKKTGNFLL